MAAYYLCARIRATDPERLSETRERLSQLEAVTQTEPACHQFQVLEDTARAGDFLLWECWEGKAGLEAHYDAPHTQALLAEKLTEIVEITELGRPGA
ncbi:MULTISPECIES: antibiotic biosynthesis monooxygenase [unclassified Halomonas]|uniref:putative quinol monooxygenase n=1 Tax=unclassified Halomonas TaxID=2609666 RepID=UPI002076A696|nr:MULTISPECIES: antibiotic biosynthesis monooxygenase [unclassified Halomonas]